MSTRSRIDAAIKPLGIIAGVLCGAGAVAAMFVVLVRVPAMANTRLETLFGTLQGTAVALLFSIAALLINLTYMVRRATRPMAVPFIQDAGGVERK
jgi:hypothetical protein